MKNSGFTTSWRDDYDRKVMTAEQAALLVRNGDRIHTPVGPHDEIQAAIAKRIQSGELSDIKLRLTAPSTDPGWLAGLPDDLAGSYEMEFELFIGNTARFVTDEKRGMYLPNLFSSAHKGQDDGRPDAVKTDVAVVRVSPPDEHGFVYFGSRVWDDKSYARRARTALAIIDSGLPRLNGDNAMHYSAFDAFVKGQSLVAPQLEPKAQDIPEDASRVAGFLSEIIRDGDCIQIGVGQPSAFMPTLGVFDTRKDLGVHTETPAPGIATLVASGVMNGSLKTIHRGKAVAGAWPSTGPEAHLVAGNPLFEVYEQEYIVNIRTVAQNKNQTAINNAISIDLVGQINSESTFGGRMINGTGGQPELHIGAFLADGGRAITLLYSSALGGARSRIVAQHDAGDMVTIPRFFADIVITEYGVARLLGKNHRQRAEALIAIAHPDHRADLRTAAEGLFYPDSHRPGR